MAVKGGEVTRQHYRRGCPATPPLQGITLRPESVARQSPDFRGLRQALPGKTAIIAANRKRKKPARQVQSLERPGSRDLQLRFRRTRGPASVAPTLHTFSSRSLVASSVATGVRRHLCKFDWNRKRALWRVASGGTFWRTDGTISAELRLNRCHGRKPKQAKQISRKQTAQDLEADEEQLKSKESLESGKVQDCPDAHAHLGCSFLEAIGYC
eukprot:s5135_g1.t1